MKTITTLLLVFFVFLLSATTIKAQEPETIDQKLERNARERTELLKQKQKALQEKQKSLQEEIDALENEIKSSGNGNVTSASTTTTVTTGARPTVVTATPITTTTPITTATPVATPVTAPALTPEAQEDFDRNVRELSSQILRAVPDPDPKPRISVARNTNELLSLIGAKINSSNSTATPANLTSPTRNTNALLDVEAVRTDKLLGANAKASGTTSLVSKGAIPLIFSFAVEHGAAVSSTSGTSTTFQFNPIGLSDFLTGQSLPTNNPEPGCRSETGLRKVFCRTSIGLTFDISRDVDVPTFTGSGNQLSQISFRYGFINKREPNLQEFTALTNTLINNVGVPVSTEQFAALRTLLSQDNQSVGGQVIRKWINDTNTELAALQLESTNGNVNDPSIRVANIGKISEVINRRLNLLPLEDIKREANISGAITRFASADELYERAKRDYLRRLYRESLFTFEYVNNRELNSPDSSNFRLIYEKGLGGSGVDFTFNGSLTAFHSRPDLSPTFTAEQRAKFKLLRDFSFAAQLDIPLFGVVGLEDGNFSLAAKYQRMNTDAFTFNNVTFADIKGDIWVGQAKLNIALGKSGFFLPLSFTYANRTELIKEKESRGNFGFTIDFSSLLERYLNGLFER